MQTYIDKANGNGRTYLSKKKKQTHNLLANS